MKKIIVLLVLLTAGLAVAEEVTPTKVFLIRHAQTLDDGTLDPALSTEGEALAQRWATVFAAEKITMIYSTDYKRTQGTAQAIAASQGDLAITSYDPRDLNLEQLKSEIAGKTVVIVGHSDTTPMVANGFLADEEFTQFGHGEYGALIVLQFVGEAAASAVILHVE